MVSLSHLGAQWHATSRLTSVLSVGDHCQSTIWHSMSKGNQDTLRVVSEKRQEAFACQVQNSTGASE